MKNQYCLPSICASLLLFVSGLSFGQTKADIAFSKVKTILKLNSVCNPVGNKLYLNKAEAILDINNIQIPTQEVKIAFFYNEDLECGSNWIKISCYDNENCILEGEELRSAIAIPLKSKDKCYEFINAFSELKNALK